MQDQDMFQLSSYMCTVITLRQLKKVLTQVSVSFTQHCKKIVQVIWLSSTFFDLLIWVISWFKSWLLVVNVNNYAVKKIITVIYQYINKYHQGKRTYLNSLLYLGKLVLKGKLLLNLFIFYFRNHHLMRAQTHPLKKLALVSIMNTCKHPINSINAWLWYSLSTT